MNEQEARMILAGIEPAEQITGPVHAVQVTLAAGEMQGIECLPGCWGDDPHIHVYSMRGPAPVLVVGSGGPVVQLDPAQAELMDTSPEACGDVGRSRDYGMVACTLRHGHLTRLTQHEAWTKDGELLGRW